MSSMPTTLTGMNFISKQLNKKGKVIKKTKSSHLLKHSTEVDPAAFTTFGRQKSRRNLSQQHEINFFGCEEAERDQSGGTDEMEQRMVKTFTSSHQELQINSPEPLPLSKHLSHRFSCAAVEQHPRSNPGVPEPSDCPAGLGRRKKKLRRVEQSSLESLVSVCSQYQLACYANKCPAWGLVLQLR